jgi:hypothetical protein
LQADLFFIIYSLLFLEPAVIRSLWCWPHTFSAENARRFVRVANYLDKGRMIAMFEVEYALHAVSVNGLRAELERRDRSLLAASLKVSSDALVLQLY